MDLSWTDGQMDTNKTYAPGIMDGPSLSRKHAIYNCSVCAKLAMLLLEASKDTSFKGLQSYDALHKMDKEHYLYEPAVDYVGEPPHIPIPKPGSHEGNGKPKGLFAFTLTFSPSDGKNEYDLKHAAEKILKQNTCPVKRYIWYLEKREDGTHPHIHGVYETESGGRIYRKVFQRYWTIWGEPANSNQKSSKGGFRGGYHKPVTFDIAYKEYIEKDEGDHVIFGEWNN